MAVHVSASERQDARLVKTQRKVRYRVHAELMTASEGRAIGQTTKCHGRTRATGKTASHTKNVTHNT